MRLRNLPGAQAAYFASAPGALRNMAAACSHPDVILGVGSSALTGGPDRDEVYIKYKVGVVPYAVCRTPHSPAACGNTRCISQLRIPTEHKIDNVP